MNSYAYRMDDGRNRLAVESFTSIGKRVVDDDGVAYELDRHLFDPRNFTDQAEQLVLWWVVRQVLRFEGKSQVTSGTFSINTITDATGYHHETIWSRLQALQARKILTYRPGKKTTARGMVILNLRLDEWLPPAPRVKKPRGRYAHLVKVNSNASDAA